MRRGIAALLIGAIALGIAIIAFRAGYMERAEPPAAASPADEAAAAPESPRPQMAAPAAADASEEAARHEQAANSRIVGGENADPQHYPWIAAIGQGDQAGNVSSYCAGTLIAPDWLVTAAHCKVLAEEYAVLGRSDLASSSGEAVRIVRVINHPRYDTRTLDYDIALAKLEHAVAGIPWVKMIDECIPPEAVAPAEGVAPAVDPCETAVKRAGNLSIAGWGRLGEYVYQTPNVLQKAGVKVSSYAGCLSN
jgi:Trypsin